MLNRRTFVGGASLLPFLNATSAPAQSWPHKPIRILYPYAAGTAVDGVARLIAQRLTTEIGQPFVVENRTGANGLLAAEAVARAPADGYTLFWATTPQITISPFMQKLNFDPSKDLTPISAVLANTFALVANPKWPPKSVSDLVTYVRAQQEPVAYAEGGSGSISHLSMVLFAKRADLKMINVSYRGNAPALTDVIAGHLPLMFTLLSDAREQAQSGAIRVLAVTSAQRSNSLPDVPTLEEVGFPGFRVNSWHGLMAPVGTPGAIIGQIAVNVSRIVNESKFAERLLAQTINPLGNSPTEFAAMLASDASLWKEAVKLAGIGLQ
jgi:tripartite-type tricarboxylate transporter receptor subunit TctC